MTENLMHEPDEAPEDHTGEAVPVEPAAATDEPEETTEGTEEDTELDESTKAGKEAAKYRRRLRETEQERDALAEQVEGLRRAAAEEIAARSGGMHKPSALWLGGATPADLLDDDGAIDREKVIATADAVATEFGITRRPRINHVPGEGANPRPSGTQGMVDAVRGRRAH